MIYWTAKAEYALPIVFVGEWNPYGADPAFALYHEPVGCSGDRLRRLICRMRVTTYHRCGRANLCVGRWSVHDARTAAASILQDAEERGLQIVALGAKVGGAFGVGDPWRVVSDFRYPAEIPRRILSLPHPSGLNRCWPRDLDRAHQALRDFAPEIPWGDL